LDYTRHGDNWDSHKQPDETLCASWKGPAIPRETHLTANTFSSRLIAV
jgi:hypothetical protein